MKISLICVTLIVRYLTKNYTELDKQFTIARSVERQKGYYDPDGLPCKVIVPSHSVKEKYRMINAQ